MASHSQRHLSRAFAAVTLCAAASGLACAAARGRGSSPLVYRLSPRRVEQRIDARGHDRLSLRATAAPPPFEVTVRFIDPNTNRALSVVRLPTDGKTTQTIGTPLPIFRVRLWASTPRDFQLTLTLR